MAVVPVTVGGSEIWDGTQASTSTRSSLYLRNAVIGNDSPVDILPEGDPDSGLFFGSGLQSGTIEGRLFDPPRPMSMMMFGGGVEAGSFVMDSIFEVMESR